MSRWYGMRAGRRALFGAAAAMVLAAAGGCGAEGGGAGGDGAGSASFPKKEITLIVQAKPGGTSDLVARTIARDVEKRLGQKIVVQNKPGASGSIAMNFVAGQRPDGYTIGYLPVEVAMLQYLGYQNVKPDRFALISGAISVPAVLTVPADSPYKTLQDFLTAAKQRPGELSVGNSGPGSIWHAATGAIEQTGGVKLRPVPFDGGAPAVVALLGDKIDAVSVGASEVLSGVTSGKLRALAVLGDERSPELPDVPTAKEAGLDAVVTGWGGFGAPKGTPQPVVDKLAGAIQAAVNSASFKQAMSKQAIDVNYRDPQAFTAFATQQSRQFAQIVPKLGVKQ
jgi:tripartite-type tricarboxylate transporter receptor subunit TctC